MRRRPPNINIFLIVIIGLLSTFGGILSNLASNEIPDSVKPYLSFAWPLLGIVTLIISGLTIWQTMRQPVSEENTLTRVSGHHQELQEKQNRQRMLDRVEAFWIKGVFEQSLHGEALIALGLSEKQDAVADPWHLVLHQPDQPEHPLPLGTRIPQVYDEALGELLILGEPGSGKTT